MTEIKLPPMPKPDHPDYGCHHDEVPTPSYSGRQMTAYGIACRADLIARVQELEAALDADLKDRVELADQVIALEAELGSKRKYIPVRDEKALVLQIGRYHKWEDEDGVDWEWFPAEVECESCIDVALVRADKLAELGASLKLALAAIEGCSAYTALLDDFTQAACVEAIEALRKAGIK